MSFFELEVVVELSRSGSAGSEVEVEVAGVSEAGMVSVARSSPAKDAAVLVVIGVQLVLAAVQEVLVVGDVQQVGVGGSLEAGAPSESAVLIALGVQLLRKCLGLRAYIGQSAVFRV